MAAFVFALLALVLLLTVGLGIARIARPGAPTPNVRRLAQVCWTLGLAVIALSVVGTVSGVVLTLAARGAPGLSQSDIARMTANGVAEAMYNSALGLFGLPAVLLARRARRPLN